MTLFLLHQASQLLLQAIGGGSILALALLTWVYAISISETLGEGAFIVSLSMIIVPIIAWVLYKERPKRAFWVSMPIAIAGLAMLSLTDGWKSSAGQLWFLANACLLALHFNVNSKLAQKIPVLLLTCIQLFVTGVLALVASSLFETIPERRYGMNRALKSFTYVFKHHKNITQYHQQR